LWIKVEENDSEDDEEKEFYITVNGIAPDINGNIELEIPEGFSGSWNDLSDKPFEETNNGIK
jgi:hypothetical protein